MVSRWLPILCRVSFTITRVQTLAIGGLDVHRYRQVRFHEAYPGIDLVVHSNQDYLEFDFEVAPGGHVADISLRFDGATIHGFKGNLEITTPAGQVFSLKKPHLYQLRAGKRQPVSGGDVLRGTKRAAFVWPLR